MYGVKSNVSNMTPLEETMQGFPDYPSDMNTSFIHTDDDANLMTTSQVWEVGKEFGKMLGGVATGTRQEQEKKPDAQQDIPEVGIVAKRKKALEGKLKLNLNERKLPRSKTSTVGNKNQTVAFSPAVPNNTPISAPNGGVPPVPNSAPPGHSSTPLPRANGSSTSSPAPNGTLSSALSFQQPVVTNTEDFGEMLAVLELRRKAMGDHQDDDTMNKSLYYDEEEVEVEVTDEDKDKDKDKVNNPMLQGRFLTSYDLNYTNIENSDGTHVDLSNNSSTSDETFTQPNELPPEIPYALQNTTQDEQEKADPTRNEGGEEPVVSPVSENKKFSKVSVVIGITSGAILLGAIGLTSWYFLHPESFAAFSEILVEVGAEIKSTIMPNNSVTSAIASNPANMTRA